MDRGLQGGSRMISNHYKQAIAYRAYFELAVRMTGVGPNAWFRSRSYENFKQKYIDYIEHIYRTSTSNEPMMVHHDQNAK